MPSEKTLKWRTEANKKNAEIRTEKLQLIIRQVCRDLKRRLSASNECTNEIRGKVKERVDADKDPVLTAYLGKNHKWPSAKTIKEAIEAMSR